MIPTLLPKVTPLDGSAPFGVDPDDVPLETLNVLMLSSATRLRAVVFAQRPGQVAVLLDNPDDLDAADDVRLELSDYQVFFHSGPTELVDTLIARMRRSEARTKESAVLNEFGESVLQQEADLEDADGSIARLFYQLVDEAAAEAASDIHIEPTPDAVVVRFRVDGILREHASYPLAISRGLINRLKILSQLDVGEVRLPQDGRFRRRGAGRDVDFRVMTVPVASGGEGAVLRLFDQSKSFRDLDKVGLREGVSNRLREVLSLPHGLVLVSGPTGSGKTTTLYSSLGIVARPDRKTFTIEDPVEIRMPSITQVEVNNKAGLTFSRALRAFLRGDPDVILVGEIRDEETAELAAQAALTGHVVLSTLHANEAAAVPVRMVNLGLDGNTVASALKAVLAQRLLRRLCTSCREPYTPNSQEFEQFKWPDSTPRPVTIFRASKEGCIRCAGEGYVGRLVVSELILVDPAMALAITDRAPSTEIERLARINGTVSLHDDALISISQGDTSFDELARTGL